MTIVFSRTTRIYVSELSRSKKAADIKIKIDTVSICGRHWYKELSAMSNGIEDAELNDVYDSYSAQIDKTAE